MNYAEGCFVGRIWDQTKGGPCLVKIKNGFVFDITSKEIPTTKLLRRVVLHLLNQWLRGS
jgi:fumarylacetoacetate (FAA) hydrolase family protein